MAGLHPYDASKSCTDIIARTYAHTWDMPVTVTRCGNLYGGGDLNWNRIVPDTIKALWEGRSPVIRSDGTFERDYLYVEDAVSGYLMLAERTPDPGVRGRAFNLGLGRPVTVLEVVDKLIAIHGKQVAPEILNQAKAEIHSQYLDCTLARELLGWTPDHELDAGLRKSYEWYTAYLDTHARP
jgi:CDP-glucose 4,6-dehydratase